MEPIATSGWVARHRLVSETTKRGITIRPLVVVRFVRWFGSRPGEDVDAAPRATPRRLWLLAALGFGVGDVVTTSIGLGMAGVVEANPLLLAAVQPLTLWSMIALKVAVFAGCYAFWKRMPRPHAVGVPLGLALAGFLVTARNVHVLLRASGG